MLCSVGYLVGLVSCFLRNLYKIRITTVEPVYGHLGTNEKCPDYQGVQVSLYDKAQFGTIT